jgi:uncharacterized coiled-coil DUF342 family protein
MSIWQRIQYIYNNDYHYYYIVQKLNKKIQLAWWQIKNLRNQVKNLQNQVKNLKETVQRLNEEIEYNKQILELYEEDDEKRRKSDDAFNNQMMRDHERNLESLDMYGFQLDEWRR